MENSLTAGVFDSRWGDAQGEFELPPSVLFVMAPDGSGRLFDLDDSFYAVDAVGVQMLRAAVHQGRDTTVQFLAQRYGAESAQIDQDYDTFFENLIGRGLVRRRCATRDQNPRARDPAVLSRPVFAAVGRLPLRSQAYALLALARMSIRLFGWNATRRAWIRRCGSTRAMSGISSADVMEAVRRAAAGHLFGVTCKERSLCCFALCRAAGIPATLVLGISLYPLASHCWCQSAEGILTDFPDRCEDFTPVVTYT